MLSFPSQLFVCFCLHILTVVGGLFVYFGHIHFVTHSLATNYTLQSSLVEARLWLLNILAGKAEEDVKLLAALFSSLLFLSLLGS